MSPLTPAPELLIVWFSRTGGTAAMVEAMQRGAAQASARVALRVLRAEVAAAEDLLRCSAAVFAAPENLASLAGEMKAFFDRSYYPLLGRIEGRPYAAAVCAGSDGHGALRQIARICKGWRMRAVAEPLLIHTAAQTPEQILAPKRLDAMQLAACEEFGATLAAGLDLGVF